MKQKKGISILGSTGSVGCNVLRVVESFPERFRVVGLAAGENAVRMAEQVARHRPEVGEKLASLVDL
jgi:1-deoxy-D-xylulose-5-phosphate reductoisomerase